MSNPKSTRTEKDFLGEIKVPESAYFGSHTARAMENFQISGITAPNAFRKALGIIKLAAANTNASMGLLKTKEEKAIEQACREFIDGKFDKEFIIDIFQAGAGTSYNMNANEIIANRANELLKGKKGEYKPVHPNNHVNMSQSSNDVNPAATRLAILLMLPGLIQELIALEEEIGKKQEKYSQTLKVGRTHLQDAVPITVGQELDSYRQALEKSRIFITQRADDLKILGIGGTAVGTGITADPSYKKIMLENLYKLTKITFVKTKNATETTNNMNSFMNFSAALRSLAVNLLNISEDIKIMSMGPKTGINEVLLPAVQPGSSIMPGKVNPSVLECVDMIAVQVLGNDKTIELSAQKSHFELNVMCPIIMYNILQSVEILTNGLRLLREKCIKGLEYNKKIIKTLFENSLAVATALVPHLGYELTAEIVKSALKKDINIKEELITRKIYTPKEIEKILSVEAITNPIKQSKIR
ncbi:MAG: aspartate ammonia-lyase [Candidatus Gracilibacteria bacterium]|jgi:aspartate ammonia-lyase